jgi:methionyl-tRNA formyltransferase
MRLIYFGTAEFAVPTLRAMAEHVVLVVSQPDRPSGRGLGLHPSPVKRAASELGIRVETPEKCRALEFVSLLEQVRADALLVAAYGQILSQAVLDSALRGGINLHGSILPKYRGAAPIQRAILEGEHETGITLMQMDKGMDSGDIISIERTPIGRDETYGELQERLSSIAAHMADEWMPRIVSGDYPRTAQDHQEATLAPKIAKDEAELKFARPALDEYARFRAFMPSPGPFLSLGSGAVRLHDVRLADLEGQPGEILATSPNLVVAFASGSLALREVQPGGKKRMTGIDWANGLRLKKGGFLQ